MPETLLHSWTRSIHSEASSPGRLLWYSWEGHLFNILRGGHSGPAFCFLLTFLSPLIPKGLSCFRNVIVIISFNGRRPLYNLSPLPEKGGLEDLFLSNTIPFWTTSSSVCFTLLLTVLLGLLSLCLEDSRSCGYQMIDLSPHLFPQRRLQFHKGRTYILFLCSYLIINEVDVFSRRIA